MMHCRMDTNCLALIIQDIIHFIKYWTTRDPLGQIKLKFWIAST